MRLNSAKERKLSRLSISLDEDLVDKFKEECDNNFIKPVIHTIKLKKIEISGSGTYERGAYYSEILRKLIIEFLRNRNKDFIDSYIRKENDKKNKKYRR